MFCPQCGAEYKENIFLCPDCHVSLVPEPLPDDRHEYGEFVQIFSTFNPGDVAIIKSLLDSEGIIYYFHGEHFMHTLSQPARLMVRKDHVEDAKEILKFSDRE